MKGIHKPQFFAMQCPKCGFWNSRELRGRIHGSLKCKRCNHIAMIRKKGVFGLAVKHHGPFPTGGGCAKAVMLLNKREYNKYHKNNIV